MSTQNIQVGDEVALKSGIWHQNEDIGDRLGVVISTKGHILVNLHDYSNNPIKCFRNEIEIIIREGKIVYEDLSNIIQVLI